MKNKVLLFVGLLILPFLVNASGIYQDIEILENGDLYVKEAIAIDGDYNGFNLKLKYKYFDENSIYSADNLEVIKVCEANKIDPLKNVSNCFNEVSFAKKGDSLKYTHTKYSDYDDFMFYNPSDRNKAFYIEYILKNVIVKYDDIAELKLNVLDDEFFESLDKVEIKVSLPNNANDLRAWAHGPLYGNVVLDDNKGYALFTIDDYSAYTAVDIRMAFDKDLVKNSKVVNVSKLDDILNEEKIKADEANKKREKARKEMERYAAYLKRVKKIGFITFGAWFIGAVIITLKIYKKYDKEYKSSFSGKYFRDFPSNHSPEIIEYLVYKNVSNNGFSSSILNIIYKKGFNIEEKIVEKGVFRKKEEKEYVLVFNDTGLKEELTEREKDLRIWLLNDYGDGSKFELSALKKVSNSESAARKFLNKYNDWIKKSKSNAEKENFYEKSSSKKGLILLYSLLAFIPGYLLSIAVPFMSFITFIVVVVFLIYAFSCKKRSVEGNELYAKWNGLKNFLNDFGSFSDKELPEIELWEKYLVYANVFGIADKVRKVMEVKVPKISDNTSSFDMLDYMVLRNAINNSVVTSVNAAVTNARSKIASSNTSSGGGFGGGFSSGGGFSGGGGSGGGRF